MKKLLGIAVLLIICTLSIILLKKYNLKKSEEAHLELINNMTLISNENCNEFYISDEITNSLYNYITNQNIDGEDDEPIVNVSWYDAITFCNELSTKNKLEPVYTLKNEHIYFNKKANGYRLPTVKEWDCANENKKTDILEWTYDYDEDNEIYKIIKGGEEKNNLLPSEADENVSFKVVKNP